MLLHYVLLNNVYKINLSQIYPQVSYYYIIQLWLNTYSLLQRSCWWIRQIKSNQMKGHLEKQHVRLLLIYYHYSMYAARLSHWQHREAVREGPLSGLCPTLINWQTHIDPAASQPCTPVVSALHSAETTGLHSNRKKHHMFKIYKTCLCTQSLTLSAFSMQQCVLVWLLLSHIHMLTHLTTNMYRTDYNFLVCFSPLGPQMCFDSQDNDCQRGFQRTENNEHAHKHIQCTYTG